MSLMPAAKNLQSESPLSGFIPLLAPRHGQDYFNQVSGVRVCLEDRRPVAHQRVYRGSAITWRRDLNNFFRYRHGSRIGLVAYRAAPGG